MKRKTIDRSEWSGITKRRYAEKRVSAFGMSGMAGLIVMDEAEEFSVPSPSGVLRITHTGYNWLSLAPENSSVWATVMFDENGELFEVYFDLTAGNHVREGGKSWFEDCFLDVVFSPMSDLIAVLDEDELEDALQREEVTAGQREAAHAGKDRLLDFLKDQRFEFLEVCAALRRELLSCMK